MEEDEEGLVDTSNGVGSATVMLEETSGDGEQPEEEVAAPLDPDQAFRNAMKAKAMDALLMLSAGSIEVGKRTRTLLCSLRKRSTFLSPLRHSISF